MNKKDIVKMIKDSVITGVCTALAGIVATKICIATDGVTDQLIEKMPSRNTGKTLEQVFTEE